MSTQDALAKAGAALAGKALTYAEIVIAEGSWRYLEGELVDARRGTKLAEVISNALALFPTSPVEEARHAEVTDPPMDPSDEAPEA